MTKCSGNVEPYCALHKTIEEGNKGAEENVGIRE